MNVKNLRESYSATYGRFAVMFSMIYMLGVAIVDQADTEGNVFGRLLVAVPLLAAIFGTWQRVSVIGLVNFGVAFGLGEFNSHGPNSHPAVYLSIFFTITLIAVFAAWVRGAVDEKLNSAIASAVRVRTLEEMASTDWLTGKLNRRGVAQAIEGVEHQFQTVVMFDIDGLKQINDTFGHRVGDKFIKHLTTRIAANLKDTDIFGRWGGDEFVLLLPHGLKDSKTIVERVIAACQESPLVVGETSIPVHLSAGLANWGEGENFDKALANADSALYAAKHRGGSCAETFEPAQDSSN